MDSIVYWFVFGFVWGRGIMFVFIVKRADGDFVFLERKVSLAFGFFFAWGSWGFFDRVFDVGRNVRRFLRLRIFRYRKF